MKVIALALFVASLVAQYGSGNSGLHPGVRPLAYGGLHAETGTTTNVSGVPIKIVGTYALSGFEKHFDEPVEGRLRYTGSPTRVFEFEIHFSFTSDTNNLILTLEVAKNGTPLVVTGTQRKISTGTDVGAMSSGFLVELATGDYLEAFLDTSTGDPDITVAHLTLAAEAID